MPNKDILKQMVNNLINDKTEEATADFSNFVHAAAKNIVNVNKGIEETAEDEDDEDDEDDV